MDSKKSIGKGTLCYSEYTIIHKDIVMSKICDFISNNELWHNKGSLLYSMLCTMRHTVELYTKVFNFSNGGIGLNRHSSNDKVTIPTIIFSKLFFILNFGTYYS